MDEGIDNQVSVEYTDQPPSHNRILVIMAMIGLLGSIAGAILVYPAFGAGFFFGTILAFVNYYWLRHSLKLMFSVITADSKPRYTALKHLLRYLILGGVIAVIYITGILPIIAVVFGMAGFGLAVVVEGFLKIFIDLFSQKKV